MRSFVLFFCCSIAAAQTPLKVKMFPGAQALPALGGQAEGMVEAHGLKVEILFTANSDEQRAGLAKGEFEIAQAAVDNAVAMVEMAKEDVVIVTGGDSSMNELIVQPEVRSLADLKGQTLLVDATNTAYALQLKKILLMNGLKEGTDYQIHPIGGTSQRLRGLKEGKKYKAAMLNLPFSLDAKASGLKTMGRATDLIGPYHATGTFARPNWGVAHRDVVER